jgi:membrane protein
VIKFIHQIPVLKKVLDKLHAAGEKIYIPGFEKVSLTEVMVFFIRGLNNASLSMRASSLAFRFFLAIFPSIIFLFTLIPYVPIKDFQDSLLEILAEIMPSNAYEATEETIEDLIRNKQGGLLSFGFFFALYLTTDGVHAMIKSFNETSHFEEHRNALKIWGISLLLVTIFTFVLVAGITLLVLSEVILKMLMEHGWITSGIGYWSIIVGKWIVLLAMFFFGLSFLYFLGPGGKVKFKFISAGSSLATAFIVLISTGFGYYVNHFGQYNKLYGSIGTIIVVMLWMYFNTLGILLGYELNNTIHHAAESKNNPAAAV